MKIYQLESLKMKQKKIEKYKKCETQIYTGTKMRLDQVLEGEKRHREEQQSHTTSV